MQGATSFERVFSGAEDDPIYSHVVKYDFLWVILAMAAAEVTTAFLYVVLKEEMYLKQPKGHVIREQEFLPSNIKE